MDRDYEGLGDTICALLEDVVLPELQRRQTEEGLFSFLKEKFHSTPGPRNKPLDLQGEMCLIWLAQNAGDRDTVQYVLEHVASTLYVEDSPSPYHTFVSGMKKIGIGLDGLDFRHYDNHCPTGTEDNPITLVIKK